MRVVCRSRRSYARTSAHGGRDSALCDKCVLIEKLSDSCGRVLGQAHTTAGKLEASPFSRYRLLIAISASLCIYRRCENCRSREPRAYRIAYSQVKLNKSRVPGIILARTFMQRRILATLNVKKCLLFCLSIFSIFHLTTLSAMRCNSLADYTRHRAPRKENYALLSAHERIHISKFYIATPSSTCFETRDSFARRRARLRSHNVRSALHVSSLTFPSRM